MLFQNRHVKLNRELWGNHPDPCAVMQYREKKGLQPKLIQFCDILRSKPINIFILLKGQQNYEI